MLNIRRASGLAAHAQSKKKHEKLGKKRDSLPSVEHYSSTSYVLLSFFCFSAKTLREGKSGQMHEKKNKKEYNETKKKQKKQQTQPTCLR